MRRVPPGFSGGKALATFVASMRTAMPAPRAQRTTPAEISYGRLHDDFDTVTGRGAGVGQAQMDQRFTDLKAAICDFLARERAAGRALPSWVDDLSGLFRG